jgi:TRAP-type C4-dicarboxylate transport system permease small subunit
MGVDNGGVCENNALFESGTDLCGRCVFSSDGGPHLRQHRSRIAWIPIKGTFELMGFFGAIVTAFALGHTQLSKGHIAVDILVDRFSNKTRKITGIINCALCCVFFVIAAWQIAIKATTLWRTGEVTETLRIIFYPFTYAVAVGCAVLALVLLVELFKTVFPGKEGEI